MLPPQFKPTIHRFETTDSTNSQLRTLAEQGAKEGTVVVAHKQTQGRGSGFRSWHSPEGGLYVSILATPKAGRPPTDLSLVAGISVAQALTQILPKAMEVTLKWPNDCLIAGKKAAGVLCEVLPQEDRQMGILGIGINANMSAEDLSRFGDRPFGATSCQVALEGQAVDVEGLLQILLKKFFTLYDLYHQGGIQPVQYLWERNCRWVGRKIELRESQVRKTSMKEFSPGAAVTGVFLGLDDLGGLMLGLPKGERRTFFSGEITAVF